MADSPQALPPDDGAGSGGGLRQTALIDAHRRLDAKLVEFGGWQMPLAYPSGTIAEHPACREDSVVFDVSHLGTVRVEGSDALNRLQARPIERPPAGGPGSGAIYPSAR